jgi:predicted RNA polymerase sigma factor
VSSLTLGHWPQIAGLYGELSRLTGSPVVELKRGVTVAEVDGPEAALAIVDKLPLYRYLHATRAGGLTRGAMNAWHGSVPQAPNARY